MKKSAPWPCLCATLACLATFYSAALDSLRSPARPVFLLGIATVGHLLSETDKTGRMGSMFRQAKANRAAIGQGSVDDLPLLIHDEAGILRP